MRTKEKDVIHICKGWYNNEKYDDEMDALKAYQSKACAIDQKYLSPMNLLQFSLFDIAKQYFEPHHWIELFKERMLKDIDFASVGLYPLPTLSTEYICELFIREIQSLQVKDGNGWIIDMSDYADKENII